MFNPDESVLSHAASTMVITMLIRCRETERNWDLDMAEDVKGEVEDKYGPVKKIKVDKMSRVSFQFNYNLGTSIDT